MEGFYLKLCSEVPGIEVKTQELMKNHTTFRTGGAADYFTVADNIETLKAIIRLCIQERMPYYILGNGSNLLVSDSGYRGVVISLGGSFCSCSADGEVVIAGAGALMSRVAKEAASASLTGFEFAAGIPGTLGGAVVMNAGAYGGEIKDILLNAKVLTVDGEVLEVTPYELDMGYRTSNVLKNGYTVLEVCLKLQKGIESDIYSKMEELANQRRSRQPLQYPSAGSTFKRPEGFFAGKLIEDAGLKGFRYGGAMVSDKHCGFVVNVENATAGEIMELCRLVVKKVKETSGVTLELEVRTLGSF